MPPMVPSYLLPPPMAPPPDGVYYAAPYWFGAALNESPSSTNDLGSRLGVSQSGGLLSGSTSQSLVPVSSLDRFVDLLTVC